MSECIQERKKRLALKKKKNMYGNNMCAGLNEKTK
jgi:hypothetical protein